MRILFWVIALMLSAGVFTSLTGGISIAMEKGAHIMTQKPEGYATATLGGGCFWCTESEYRALDGVLFTRVGYMGGETNNPTYRDITTGKTGHAEVVEVTFDPDIISYEQLLMFFLTKAHDPTQLNRQGVDKGTQYRSVIFPHDDTQRDTARSVLDKLNKDGTFKDLIVTTIEPFATFWEGEEYHQQYYEKYEEETGKTHIRVLMKKAGKL